MASPFLKIEIKILNLAYTALQDLAVLLFPTTVAILSSSIPMLNHNSFNMSMLSPTSELASCSSFSLECNYCPIPLIS